MRTEGKISQVAVCPICDRFILACHIDFIDDISEKEFTVFSKEGFKIKRETAEQTRAREYGDYNECSKGKCK